jgi:hypothetical protein
MTDVAKPLPVVNEGNRPFWDGANEGRLRMQRCERCRHIRYPIQPHCPKCLATDTEWIDLSGKGEVFSKIVYQRAFHPAFADDVPYNVVLIQLQEGPRMFSNVVGSPTDEITVGAAVSVVFEEAADGVAIPRFRLDT